MFEWGGIEKLQPCVATHLAHMKGKTRFKGENLTFPFFFFPFKKQTEKKLKTEDLIAITQPFPRGLQVLQTELSNLKSEDNIK